MVHLPANTLDVVPLMMVRLATTADFSISGTEVARFTLPKAQIEGRGFALQLFALSFNKKKQPRYRAIWTFNASTLKKQTLTFAFRPSATFTIAKKSPYVFVLYGDDKAKSSPSGSATPSALPSPAESPIGSPLPADAPTASPRP